MRRRRYMPAAGDPPDLRYESLTCGCTAAPPLHGSTHGSGSSLTARPCCSSSPLPPPEELPICGPYSARASRSCLTRRCRLPPPARSRASWPRERLWVERRTAVAVGDRWRTVTIGGSPGPSVVIGGSRWHCGRHERRLRRAREVAVECAPVSESEPMPATLTRLSLQAVRDAGSVVSFVSCE